MKTTRIKILLSKHDNGTLHTPVFNHILYNFDNPEDYFLWVIYSSKEKCTMTVENITTVKMPDLLPIGTVCNLKDLIEPEISVNCTVRLVEQDDEIPTIFYYYLRANSDEKNIQYDPRIGAYFDIIANGSNRLTVIAPPTAI